MKKILIYGNKIEDIEKKLGDQEIEVSFLRTCDLDSPMFDLIEKKQKEWDEQPECFWYLFEFDKESIKELDMYIKEQGIQIDLMAVATEANINWTLKELLIEIKEEQEYFNVRQELINEVMHPDKERLKKDSMYLRILSMSYALIEDTGAEKSDFLNAIQAIRAIK